MATDCDVTVTLTLELTYEDLRRSQAYAAINSERDYQGRKWGDPEHSVTEFLVYMRDYIEEALHVVSRQSDPDASLAALHSVRKVAALGVACMEQCGAPHRREEGPAR